MLFAAAIVFAAGGTAFAQPQPARMLPGHVPGVVARLQSQGRLPATNPLALAIGLPLRNEAELTQLLADLYDPASPRFRQFLTPQEFTTRFGPTETDYAVVQAFVRSNGFTVVGTHDNRLVLDVEAPAAAVERAFHVTLRRYRHPTEPRDFYAPDTEPAAPAGLPIADLWGLSDYGLPKPLSRPVAPLEPRSLAGSGPSGYFAGDDFRRAYCPGTTLTGAGQSVGLLQFSDYYRVDITNYQNTIGRTNYVKLTDVIVNGVRPTKTNNAEVALDIEMALAMAPGLYQVIVYEIKTVSPSTILNRMATDNLAKQLSSSWSWSGGPNTTVDNIFKQMAAQGQSFFQASGDSDAYTGSQALDNVSQTTAPVDSPYVTSVGGTKLTMNGSGVSWASEIVWNYNPYGGALANVGSGGGSSTYYTIPAWQTNVSMAGNSGSTTMRNIPDVALTADSIYVAYNNGSSGGLAGTSAAAPLWAGFCALVNQQSVATTGTTVGFLNPALYRIATNADYANCFNDITTGNNIGTNTPGLYSAVAGYDLCTGLGTPRGVHLIAALAPTPPAFLTQPGGQNVTNGGNVTLTAAVSGTAPLAYQWLLDDTNVATGGNVSGTTSNVLTLSSVTTNNAGGYRLVVTNSYGAATSSVAVVNVGLAPTLTTPPTGLTLLAGSNAMFSATATGTAPLAYQWRRNGVNLANTASISGATSNVLTISEVTTNNTGNYSVVVANLFGTRTSSAAGLSVVLPPTITGNLTNHTVECGSNVVVFAITAAGTPPFTYQWTLDAAPVSTATNSTFSLTNLLAPDHAVAVSVSNAYAGLVSNIVVAVLDTQAPGLTLDGDNPMFLSVGEAFVDPGATAADVCAGVVPVWVGGMVNTAEAGTNFISYTADDASGNTNTVVRMVIVTADPTPLITSVAVNPSHGVHLNLAGAPGRTYVLQINPDLFNPLGWQAAATNTLDATGVWEFTDTEAATQAQRFYRLMLVP